MGTGHRDAEERVAVDLVEGLGESGAFVSKDERVARFEAAVVERLLAMRREEEYALRTLRGEILLPCVVDRLVEMGPVVESGARDGFVVEVESERSHEVEFYSQSDA